MSASQSPSPGSELGPTSSSPTRALRRSLTHSQLLELKNKHRSPVKGAGTEEPDQVSLSTLGASLALSRAHDLTPVYPTHISRRTGLNPPRPVTGISDSNSRIYTPPPLSERQAARPLTSTPEHLVHTYSPARSTIPSNRSPSSHPQPYGLDSDSDKKRVSKTIRSPYARSKTKSSPSSRGLRSAGSKGSTASQSSQGSAKRSENRVLRSAGSDSSMKPMSLKGSGPSGVIGQALAGAGAVSGGSDTGRQRVLSLGGSITEDSEQKGVGIGGFMDLAEIAMVPSGGLNDGAWSTENSAPNTQRSSRPGSSYQNQSPSPRDLEDFIGWDRDSGSRRLSSRTSLPHSYSCSLFDCVSLFDIYFYTLK